MGPAPNAGHPPHRGWGSPAWSGLTTHSGLRLNLPHVEVTPDRSGWRVTVKIAETLLACDASELGEWVDYRNVWRRTGVADARVWGKFAPLLENGRYHFAGRCGSHPYGFGEAVVALALHRCGFTTWTGVHLFGRRPRTASARVRNTQAVERLLQQRGCPVAPELHSVNAAAKNPDIAAYHPRRDSWCFCEVKRAEKVDPGQVIGLSILHLLTGADIGIVRLVERVDMNAKIHTAQFRWPSSVPLRACAMRQSDAKAKRKALRHS